MSLTVLAAMIMPSAVGKGEPRLACRTGSAPMPRDQLGMICVCDVCLKTPAAGESWSAQVHAWIHPPACAALQVHMS